MRFHSCSTSPWRGVQRGMNLLEKPLRAPLRALGAVGAQHCVQQELVGLPPDDVLHPVGPRGDRAHAYGRRRLFRLDQSVALRFQVEEPQKDEVDVALKPSKLWPV